MRRGFRCGAGGLSGMGRVGTFSRSSKDGVMEWERALLAQQVAHIQVEVPTACQQLLCPFIELSHNTRVGLRSAAATTAGGNGSCCRLGGRSHGP